MENVFPLHDWLVMGCCKVEDRGSQKWHRVLQGCCRVLQDYCRVLQDCRRVGHRLHLHLCLEKVSYLGTLQLWS